MFSMFPAPAIPPSPFSLSLFAAGATPVEAAELANRASGIVVGKLGTATVTPGRIASQPARP